MAGRVGVESLKSGCFFQEVKLLNRMLPTTTVNEVKHIQCMKRMKNDSRLIYVIILFL